MYVDPKHLANPLTRSNSSPTTHIFVLSRTDHLYVFFIQWSPDMYGDGLGGISQEPGFMVVKKLEESEGAEEQASTTTDATDSKEWEVRPLHPSVDYSNELFCFVKFCLFVF